MANQIQEAILSAVDTLVNNRIDKIEADKTVTATIVQCTNSLTNEYKVSYNGGMMFAYAQDGTSYSQNATVYVLVPQGDFTQKKTIISKAQALEDDSNITFVSSALSNYNLIGKNPISDPLGLQPVEMCSYLKDNYVLLYQRDLEDNFLTIDEQELLNNIKEAEAILIEASFKNRFPKEHRINKNGIFGVQFILAFQDRDNPEEVKYYSYVIDNNNMTGNPSLFLNWSDQYMIFPIDTENFLYIDTIMAFCNDFVEEDDRNNAELWGEDVFVKDIEFYGLKTITATNGDYKMSLSMPLGSTFRSIQASDYLQVVGKITKLSDILSDSTMWYWFAEDGRVTSTSEDYQAYGGTGWRYLKDKGNTYTLTLYGNENKAYENKYLCVAVYKETMILKEYFTIYNEAARRDLSITSSLGVKFSFDRGKPTLTCLVDGKESNFEGGKQNAHPDDWFTFVWSKIDTSGQTLTFNETIEELQQRYDQGILDGIGYNELSALRNKILQMEGAEFELGKNKLAYPVKNMESTAIFNCSVYLRDTSEGEDYSIGSASIVLQNEGAASPTDYYIIIENGDQVFQYSESGVSPDDERYTDPLELKNLTCHFYDPAGLEVNEKTYSVKWLVPLEDSMIVVPREGMEVNPATEKEEWCVSQVYPMEIADDYDYQALNNQVKAIVEYQGQEYTEQTTFLFTKVGENGTNGTDMVAKIAPTSDSDILENELLSLELENGIPQQWNTGQTLAAKVFDFHLYQRNEEINIPNDITWSMAGGNNNNSKYMSVRAGTVTWDNTNAIFRKYRNQIVKATTRVDSTDYYAFYPVPVIDYNSSINYKVKIDSVKTLKTILYNADGRNPLYNKNQGVFLTLGTDTSKYIVWRAEGGVPALTRSSYADNPLNSAFTLTYEKNSADGQTTLVPRQNEDGTYESLTSVYILPNDVYDGAYCNNVVHCRIYNTKANYDNNGNPEVEIYIPIHMSLNTYGLQSLNSWDGNHLEINEDQNYILAPQIGAGVKHAEDNTFTGVVMGSAQTYDQSEPDIGLLGYSHGKQSIFLNAEDGSAIFGLPEDQASTNNKYEEGRIELNPGGESKIGMWTIGSRAMYNITKPSLGQDQFEKVEPGTPYTDYPVDGAQMAIPHDSQGMLLNANPAYFSVKGMPLTEDNDSIEWGGANTVIMPGDSLEVEIDPRKSSVFSIYRHTTYDGAEDTKEWRRYPLVGINSNGQFYTNAIEDGESSMGIGVVGAFKESAATQRYVGAQFAWKGTNLFKFFVDTEDENTDENKKLHISTGTYVDRKVGQSTVKGDEYPREIGVYGKSVTLYAPSTNATNEPDSDHKIEISQDSAYFGHNRSYINIPYNSGESARIELQNQLDLSTAPNRPMNFTTGQFVLSTLDSTMNDPDIGLSSGQNIQSTAVQDYSINTGRFYKMYAQDFHIDSSTKDSVTETRWNENMSNTNNSSNTNSTYTNVRELDLGNEKAYIKLRPTGIESRLHSETGFNITTNTGGIYLNSQHSANGIILNAVPPNGSASQGVRLSLIPQDGGGSDFIMLSPHGSVRSMTLSLNNSSGSGSTGSRYNTIQLYPGFSTSWGQITGTLPHANTISLLTSRDIKSTGGWMYAGDFAFNTSKSFDYWNGTATGTQLSAFLSNIYSLLNNLRSRMSTAERDIDNAQSRADSAYNLANNKVDKSTYDNHVHGIVTVRRGYGRYSLSTGGLYTDIDGTGSSGYVITSIGDSNNNTGGPRQR